MRVIKVENYDEMSRVAANIISAQVVLKPTSVLGLATGSTPIGAYAQLVQWYKEGYLDFSQVITLNLDEYSGLAEGHVQSYRYFMDTQLFNHVNIEKANTHVPNSMAEDIAKECERYDALFEEADGIDLQLLGLGNNGHIGFNEPDDAFAGGTHQVKLHEMTIKANSILFSEEEEVPQYAITVGMKNIMKAKRVLLIVGSENKKEILEKALYGPITPLVPASILQLHPHLDVITV